MIPPREDQCEWHRMTRMTGPDCVVMCNLINTHTHTHTHTHFDRGQLNRRKIDFPCFRSRQRIWSRERGSDVPSRVSLLILHTQAESGAYSRYSSCFPRRRSFIYFNRLTLSGQSRIYLVTRHCVPMAFTAERVRRHTASSPQSSWFP